jgi:hypothetical protein
VEKIITSLRAGNYRCTASKVAGISFRTFKVWFKKYPAFAQQVLLAEAHAEDMAVKRITDYDDHKDLKYLCWWLERKCADRWNSGVYRWEFQVLQKQLKELKNVIRELTQNQEGDKQPNFVSQELPAETKLSDTDPQNNR